MPPKKQIPSGSIIPPPPRDPDLILIRPNRTRNPLHSSLSMLSDASPYFASHITQFRSTRYINLTTHSSPTVSRMLYFLERDSFSLDSDDVDISLETSKTHVGRCFELIKLAEEVQYERLRDRAMSILVYEMIVAGNVTTVAGAKEVLALDVKVDISNLKEYQKGPHEVKLVTKEVDKWVLGVVTSHMDLFVKEEGVDIELYLQSRKDLFKEVLKKREARKRLKERAAERERQAELEEGGSEDGVMVGEEDEGAKMRSIVMKQAAKRKAMDGAAGAATNKKARIVAPPKKTKTVATPKKAATKANRGKARK